MSSASWQRCLIKDFFWWNVSLIFCIFMFTFNNLSQKLCMFLGFYLRSTGWPEPAEPGLHPAPMVFSKPAACTHAELNQNQRCVSYKTENEISCQTPAHHNHQIMLIAYRWSFMVPKGEIMKQPRYQIQMVQPTLHPSALKFFRPYDSPADRYVAAGGTGRPFITSCRWFFVSFSLFSLNQ